MFWNSTPKNYTEKRGYLVPKDGENMAFATLRIYPNGICIINARNDVFEATLVDAANYTVNSYFHPRFIVTE